MPEEYPMPGASFRSQSTSNMLGAKTAIGPNPFDAMEERIVTLAKQLDDLNSQLCNKTCQLIGENPLNEDSHALAPFPSVSFHGGQIGAIGSRLDQLSESVTRLRMSANRILSL